MHAIWEVCISVLWLRISRKARLEDLLECLIRQFYCNSVDKKAYSSNLGNQ